MSEDYKKEAKASHEKKLRSYGEGASGKAKNFAGFDALNTTEQRGAKVIDKEPELSKETAPRIMRKAGGAVKGAESLKRLDKTPRKGKALGGARPGPVPTPQEQEQRFSKGGASTTKHMPEVARREKGGKVGHMEWEHSKKDLEQDKKLAKKHGMSMEKWEKSDLDKKHDKQQSTEGLKKGGAARMKRASGGGAFDEYEGGSGHSESKGKEKKAAGRTSINIIIGQQPTGAPAMGGATPAMAGAPAPMAPPPMPPAAPAMMAPPSSGPAMMGPPPAGPGGLPLPRKDGGRAFADIKVDKPKTKDGYPVMTAGSGSGKGRREKILAQE